MKDIMGLMKKAQEMQARMAEMQEGLGNLVVEGRAGGGLVTVSLSAKGELKGIHIDPSLFREDDVSVLEDLLLAAHADARGKADAEAQQQMADLTAGLPLPPGMKFPF